MKGMYTDERNAQIVIQLLKAHNIRRVVVSPGTTNACFVASIQNDSYFAIISAPEERSAGYIACGMAAETQEPVVLSCTGATASRNYMPALTEAYYRKLPVLVITSSRRNAYIGHNIEQVTDRTVLPNDVVNLSVQVPVILDDLGEWQCVIATNKALLELRRNGGGPVHINLETIYSTNGVNEIAPVRAIYRYDQNDSMPELHGENISIIVGSHFKWSKELTEIVDRFCEKYNAIVLCDHTSNYWGKYRVFGSLAAFQKNWTAYFRKTDVVIHIGDVSGAVFGLNRMKEVWRINPDGEIRDTFQNLKYIFAMDEIIFFRKYTENYAGEKKITFYSNCNKEEEQLREKIPELPFSNAWVANMTADKIPENAVLHLGINNSLRVWNFFDLSKPVLGYSNVGGYGIDGPISTAMGAALCTPDKNVFCFLGDLAFFYDINALGNRHFPSNIRIVIINNGMGMEMNLDRALARKIALSLGTEATSNISAMGHYGQKKKMLVKNVANSLGYEYHAIHDKAEYLEIIPLLTSPEIRESAMILELFVNPKDDNKAIEILAEILTNSKQAVKGTIKQVLGEKQLQKIKRIVNKNIY